jgi:hypothetical protein
MSVVRVYHLLIIIAFVDGDTIVEGLPPHSEPVRDVDVRTSELQRKRKLFRICDPSSMDLEVPYLEGR